MNTAHIVVLANAFDGSGIVANLASGSGMRAVAAEFLAGCFISSATEIPNSTTTQT